MSSKRLMLHLMAALFTGILVGYVVHVLATAQQNAVIAEKLSLLTDMFLRLIQMIVGPLILSTLIAGIARVGNQTGMGRLGLHALIWFLCASLVSLALGLVMANVLQAGAGFDVSVVPVAAASAAPGPAISLQTFALHLVPRSVFEALSSNDVLQIIVFSLFAGSALASLGPKGGRLLGACEAIAELMLVVTGYVMRLAPLAVFVAIAGCVASGGPSMLLGLGKLVVSFYLALLLLWIILVSVAFITLGRSGAVALLRVVREPVLLAFATASSEAAYPSLLAQLERLGVPKPVASSVLPLGYSFNLDGSMLYCAFAVLFISQAYDVPLTLTQQVGTLLLLMLMSKGMAGVPRASLVVLATALPHLPLPAAGVALLLGIDQVLDMGRTATNVFGNSVATAAIARWHRRNTAPA